MAASARGYAIVEIEVLDAEAYKKYTAGVPASLAPFGGRFLVRGGATISLEGDPPKRVVVLEFPDMATAQRWYHSPVYQALLPLRLKASKARFFFVEGMPPSA